MIDEIAEQLLLNRIARLEDALSYSGRPYVDLTCECCGSLFVPGNSRLCRCNLCFMTCSKAKGAKEWTRGHLCPSLKARKDD